jgi:hypothetical protein
MDISRNFLTALDGNFRSEGHLCDPEQKESPHPPPAQQGKATRHPCVTIEFDG